MFFFGILNIPCLGHLIIFRDLTSIVPRYCSSQLFRLFHLQKPNYITVQTCLQDMTVERGRSSNFMEVSQVMEVPPNHPQVLSINGKTYGLSYLYFRTPRMYNGTTKIRTYGGFLKWGRYPSIIHFRLEFSTTNHPYFWGIPQFIGKPIQ